MRGRLSAALAGVTLAACAGHQAERPKVDTGAETKAVQQVAYFDVATCGQRPIAPPAVVTPRSLAGYVSSLEPWVTECLVDDRHRGAAPLTRVTLETTVTEEGARTLVRGENLLPAGQACVQAAVDRLTRGLTSVGGGTPIKAKIDLQHDRDHGPSSQTGGDPATQFTSRVRLAFPTWCECFAPWKSLAPHPLQASVALNTPAHPVSVEVELTNDSASDEVAHCLQRKMQTLDPGGPPGASRGELHFVAPLYFIHSGVSESLMGVPASIQYTQMQAVRHQRAADVATREATREQAAAQVDALLKKSPGKPTRGHKAAARTAELKDACTELLKVDTSWASALSQQLEIQEETASLAGDLKAKDPAWAQVEKSARSALAAIQALYDKAKAARNDDAASCARY